MIDYIDLLSLIKHFGGILRNVTVYGYTNCRLNKPANLDSSCELQNGGIFVCMSVCAVDLSYYAQYLKEIGIYNKGCKYFVNGSICMYVSANGKYPDWYSCRTTLRLGEKRPDTNYLVSFEFRKSGSNWQINYNSLSNIDRDEDFKYSPRIKSFLYGGISFPEEVKQLPKISCIAKEVEFNVNSKEEVIEDSTDLQVSGGEAKRKSLIGRTEIREFSEKYDEYSSILQQSKRLLEGFKEDIKNEYSNEPLTSYISAFLSRLKTNTTRGQGKDLDKLVGNYISRFGVAKNKYMGTTIRKYILSNFNEIIDYILNDEEPLGTEDYISAVHEMFDNPEYLYASALGTACGMSLVDAEQYLSCLDISFSKVVNNNPYLLKILGLVSISDAQKLEWYLCGGTDLTDIRNVTLLHSFISDKSVNDTAFKYDYLMHKELGIKVPQHIHDNGLNLSIKTTIEAFFIDTKIIDYDYKGWQKRGYMYVNAISLKSKEKACKDYIDIGLGAMLDDYVTSSQLLEQELYVYKTLYDLGSTKYDCSDEDINKYISEYEEVKGFKLEERQNSAISLIKYGSAVLTGGAGSGKTTTEGCIVDVLRKLEPDIEIKYGAPTGKAAKVMQGVVKEKTSTMHSLCKVSSETDSIFDSVQESTSESNVVYIFDEVSMVTIDLLYKVLKKLGKVRVYFIGDINQLSAIGKGLVLKNLLRFLPCEYLTVSKRSSENSKITRNSDLINYNSDKNSWLNLQDGDDFIRYCVADNKIQSKAVEVVKQELANGIDKDDIQVVSPIAKSSYTWGVFALNNVLQPIINKNRDYNSRYNLSNGTMFIKGDRVIQSKVNQYNMQWYDYDGGTTVTKLYGYGINNGEVGEFVGVITSNNLTINDEVEDKPDEFEYPKNLRDDSAYTSGSFAIVKYYDVMNERYFYILYRCKYREKSDGKALYGEDIDNLELFYCGSVHKLQGSQAKVVVCCLGTVGFKGFITRNLLYTMITRASSKVYLIGSVDDSLNSMLSKGRIYEDAVNVVTIGELLYKDG